MSPKAEVVPFREPLADALLPALMHRLKNVTQLLAALEALFADGGGDELVARRADDLADASRALEELGWALAVLATAGGADLVLERRARDGLAPLLALVREALDRQGVALSLPAALPSPAAAVGDGWQLPWAVAALALAVGATRRAPGTLDVAFERGGDGWTIVFPLGAVDEGASLAATAERVRRVLPGATVELDGAALTLLLPRGWLVSAS